MFAGRCTPSVTERGKVMHCKEPAHVLLIVLMAHPDQASSLQGCHRGNGVTLAANNPGTASGWKQSRVTFRMVLAVVGTWVRTRRNHLWPASLALFHLFGLMAISIHNWRYRDGRQCNTLCCLHTYHLDTWTHPFCKQIRMRCADPKPTHGKTHVCTYTTRLCNIQLHVIQRIKRFWSHLDLHNSSHFVTAQYVWGK